MLEALLNQALEVESQMVDIDSWFNNHEPDQQQPVSPMELINDAIVEKPNEVVPADLPRVGSTVLKEQESEQVHVSFIPRVFETHLNRRHMIIIIITTTAPAPCVPSLTLCIDTSLDYSKCSSIMPMFFILCHSLFFL